MASNTIQYRHMATIKNSFECQLLEDPNVFVAGDLFRYPVEDDNQTRTTPDVRIVFGRPKGDRSSCLQWLEDNIPPQVVVEILSPGNRYGELVDKFKFYKRFGILEYILYDPEQGILDVWTREGNSLKPVPRVDGWISPHLKVEFTLEGRELVLYHPDGERPRPSRKSLLKPNKPVFMPELERQRAQEAVWRAARLAESLTALGLDPDEIVDQEP